MAQFLPRMNSQVSLCLYINEIEKNGVLAYRTFRIHFNYDDVANKVVLQQISSGYTDEELKIGAEDKYGDKQVHREFLSAKI